MPRKKAKGNGQGSVYPRKKARSTEKDLEEVIGCRPEAFCDSLVANRPEWVKGSLSYFDTRFLFNTTLKAGANLAVEIGTASGFSTSVLCHALNFASQAGTIDSDFHVVSYDVSLNFYADRNKRVGDATREQLSPELLKHVTFRHPAFASSLEQHHGNDDIGFLLVDANLKHPWPTLDLLAALDSLSPGAMVVLHDINLPIIHREFSVWGAKYLFDGLDLEKGVPDDVEIPNIGCLKIPEDKEQLRGQLLKILFTPQWEVDVNDDYLAGLGITIENNEAVVQALRGTEFEYCPDDERMYLNSQVGAESRVAQQNKVDVAYLKSKPWVSKAFVVPQEVFAVRSMLSDEERRMLYYLALNYYSEQGAIVDLGAYLGGSTICFAAALQQFSFTKPPIHSYDRFRLSTFELELDFRDNAPKDLRTREIFEENLRDYRHLLNVHEGDVLDFPWEEEDRIELLFVDIAKTHKVFDHILLSYFPSLIPMQSLVILQDYIWQTEGPWHHVVMEKLSDYFEYIADTNINSVVFLLTQSIPQETLRQCSWTAIPYEEKGELMKRAIDKLDTESKKEHLRKAWETHLQESI